MSSVSPTAVVPDDHRAEVALSGGVRRPQRLTFEKVLKCTGVALVLVLVAHAVDRWAHSTIFVDRIIEKDLWWTFRIFGAMYMWLGVAAVFIIDDSRPTALKPWLKDRFSRAVILLMSMGIAAGIAELGKLTFRRSRPLRTDEWTGYVWNWPAESLFNSSGMGLPSSHTAVAFGAAAAMAYLHPRYAAVWFAVAFGTAAQRVAARAHYVSDVTLAACIGIAVGAVVWRLHWRMLDGAKSRGESVGA